ncbi:MAG: xanthine dehydrogenase family protein molybdopterin-binding subunit [Pseudomonadota bacterium]
MTHSTLGESVPRLEDQRFLTGAGQYIDDIHYPDELFAHFIRSEQAHARLLSVDFEEAAELDGVVAVYTVADLKRAGLGNLPCDAAFEAVRPLVKPPRPALADGVVRHVGDPVAVVIATSADAAQAAAELVLVDYEPMVAVVEPDLALADGAQAVWPEAPGNLAYEFVAGDEGAVADAMAHAAHIVEVALVNNRVTAAPMENRAAVGLYDAANDAFTLHCNGQGVHGIRKTLAEAVFGVSSEQMRVKAPDVGGGFGLKNFLYPEHVVLLFAARALGSPVRWSASRTEDFLSAAYGRDMLVNARLGLDPDGRFMALSADAIANMGAYLSGSGPNISTRAMPTAMGGIYAIPAIHLCARGVFTNTVPTDAYRGAGKPEANYLVERLIDKAARQLNIDPLSLRRMNAVSQFPYQMPLGPVIDGGQFAANLDAAAVLLANDDFTSRRTAARRDGILLGRGVACFLETSRGATEEGAEIIFAADGQIEIRVGTESHGQGHETSYPQLAGARLGLPLAAFRYVQADTHRTHMGHGHGGARTMHMGGKALMLALDDMLEKASAEAAALLQCDAQQVRFDAGRFASSANAASVTLAEVVSHVTERDGGAGALDTFASHHDAPIAFPNGCHVAEVAVDEETGTVELRRYLICDDYGTLVNPRLTAGQVVGGVAQGIGQALAERVCHEPDSGQLLSGSLMDYQILRARELPDFEVHLDGVPTTANPLGVKGSGQAGCIAAPQTIVHAILDAVAELGIEHLDMPVTPGSLWPVLHTARKGRLESA